MIGNLFLALGLACLSASAVSTDNFNRVTRSVSGSSATLLSTDVIKSDNNGFVSYTCLNAVFTLALDNTYDEDTFLFGGLKDNFTYYSSSYTGSYDSYQIYHALAVNNLRYGWVFHQEDDGHRYIQLFTSTSHFTYEETDNTTTNFMNDSVGFKLQNNSGTPLFYDVYFADLLTTCGYSSLMNAQQLSMNGLYYCDIPSFMLASQDKNLLVMPFTFDIESNINYLTIQFVSNHFDDNNNYQEGFTAGYNNGYNTGLTEGYQNGYAEGIRVGTSANADVKNLFGVIADTPIRFLKQMFNFELFGMNVAVVILSCLTAICMFALIKKIWK